MSEINSDWLAELAPDYYQDKKAEIVKQKHEAEVKEYFDRKDSKPDTLPVATTIQHSIEIGVARPKKPESNRDALLKKKAIKRIMISDMDFDE